MRGKMIKVGRMAEIVTKSFKLNVSLKCKQQNIFLNCDVLCDLQNLEYGIKVVAKSTNFA